MASSQEPTSTANGAALASQETCEVQNVAAWAVVNEASGSSTHSSSTGHSESESYMDDTEEGKPRKPDDAEGKFQSEAWHTSCKDKINKTREEGMKRFAARLGTTHVALSPTATGTSGSSGFIDAVPNEAAELPSPEIPPNGPAGHADSSAGPGSLSKSKSKPRKG